MNTPDCDTSTAVHRLQHTQKNRPRSRSFLQLESGQISLICNQIGAGRHPRSGQGFLPAPITPSFFLALFRGFHP